MARLSRHENPLSKSNEHGNNPNQITVNQHVIPKKHILEWSSDGKMVDVFDIEKNKSIKIPANSAYFCVMRLWDQWTESEMLKVNENNYQDQIDLIKSNGEFKNSGHILAYYILLCVRIFVANKERPHYPSMFTSISHDCDKSELEDNELKMNGPIHFVESTIDPNSQHMARQVVKMTMNKLFLDLGNSLKEQNWILFQADDEGLVLSDSLYNNFTNDLHILPINTRQALITTSTHKKLEAEGHLSTNFINNLMKNNSINYYIDAPKKP